MLVQVKATSADEGSNANIVYLIQSGSDGSFEIDVESGEIENKVEMDYEKKNHYRLEVRARSGNYHDTAFVDIYLKDMNDNAPEIQPFQVFLNIYNDTFPTEPLFKIPAEDKDASSVLKYTVTGGRGKDFVSLNSKTGMLSLKETILNTDRIVEITVQVEDGEPAHKVSTLGEITGILIDDDMIRNSIGIILNDTTRDEFLTAATIAKFKDAFAKAVGRDFPKVYLLSINPNPQLASSGNSKVPVLQVSVAVKKTLSTGYVPAVELRNQLFLNRELFTMKFPKNIIAVDNDNEIMCGVEICLNYQRCSIEPRYKGSSSVMQTKTVIFRGVNPEPDRNTCSCSAGFQDLITKSINERCNAKYSLCYSKPCGKYGRCINNEASYKCVCDDGYTGKNCEINMRGSQCPEDSGSLCKNGGKCHSKITGIGIECKCRTSRGTLTPSCELTGRYFPAGSFASFPGMLVMYITTFPSVRCIITNLMQDKMNYYALNKILSSDWLNTDLDDV